MESSQVLTFIQETGFRTLMEIHEKFKEGDQELLNSVLIFLVEKCSIRKILFQSPHGEDTMYYQLPTR